MAHANSLIYEMNNAETSGICAIFYDELRKTEMQRVSVSLTRLNYTIRSLVIGDDIRSQINQFAADYEHKNCDSFVCAVISSNQTTCNPNKIADDIIFPFTRTSSLINKPKLFIFDSIQDEAHVSTVNTEDASNVRMVDSDDSDVDYNIQRDCEVNDSDDENLIRAAIAQKSLERISFLKNLPMHKDILVAYSIHSLAESEFLNEMFEILDHYEPGTDICKLLTRLNFKVEEKSETGGDIYSRVNQISGFLSMFRKEFHFRMRPIQICNLLNS